MTRPQQQFLELLRAGLWGTPADPELFQGPIDWQSILRIAKEQAVQVITADGIETLPNEMWPPKEAILKLMMIRIKTQQMHHLLNATLNKVTQALNAAGIPSVLLKGQGVAQNYRNPESRMCGDIDLYVGEENYLKACEILEKAEGAKMPDTTECESHIVIEINGVIIELHHKTDVLNGKKRNDSWIGWSIERIDEKYGSQDLARWYNNGTPIATPDPTYNALYLMRHMTRHMISEGIGFRHVCDWAMFLHKNHHLIDMEVLGEKIKEYQMAAPWKEFSTIAHHLIGLPKECIPFFPSGKAPQSNILAEYIFDSGNFGRYSSDKRTSDKNYIKRKWHNFRFQMLRLAKLVFIFPSVTLSYGLGWFTDAVKRFFIRK